VRSLIVVFLSLLMVPGVRAAEQPSDVATAHVRKATAAYNLGKYTDAAKEYEAAYEQTLDANLLFNIGQAYRLAGERDRAIVAYRSFIRSAPDSEQRQLAESKIREIERQRSAPPPAPAPEPAVQAAPAPSPPPAVVAPAATPELPAAAPVAALPAPSPAPVPTPAPPTTESPRKLIAASVAPEPSPPTPFYKGWPFWTAVGAVVAGAVVLTIVLTRPSNSVNMNAKFGTQEF
jgi:tetratricopeptide (TPR) repeat protein